MLEEAVASDEKEAHSSVRQRPSYEEGGCSERREGMLEEEAATGRREARRRVNEQARHAGRSGSKRREGCALSIKTASEACERKRQRPEGGRRTVVQGRERGMRERAAVFSFCGKMKSILAFKNKETSKS